MLLSKNKLRLNLYLYLCYLAFIFAFIHSYRLLRIEEWVIILAFATVSLIFELNVIVLPSGEALSLISPILLVVGVSNGFFPVILMVLFVTAFMLMKEFERWYATLFNGVQYAFSTWGGIWAYEIVSSQIASAKIGVLVAYVSFIPVFFILNVMFVSSYLLLRDGMSALSTIKMLFEKKSILIYVTMMAIGSLMAEIIISEGYLVAPVLTFILWGLGASYRHYYKMYEHFKSLSIKDELTGLYNHRYFQEKLQEVIEEEDKAALLLMDLDHFKIYNDYYGHPAGDKILKNVADLIIQSSPDQGIACRYGGEEFAVILANVNSEEAIDIAEKIRKAIASANFEGMENLPDKKITISIGVSSYPAQAKSKEELIMIADQALYRVKHTTRNKVRLYTSIVDELKAGFEFGTEETKVIHMIETFLTIVNSKDRYTYGHTEQVTEYAEALSRKLGLSAEEARFIRYGALLHDIGKVEVPTEILTKRSRLTQEEWKTIKLHVTWGEQIVQPIKELEQCLPFIRHHHEHFDGTGYPDQLAGKDIPLGARILTLVDSFDAMTTNRPYQNPKTVSEAIDELRRCAGTHFDPELIEPFIEIVKELVFRQTKDA